MAKYRNVRTTVALRGREYRFDSKKEARRFLELAHMARAGIIRDLTLQPEYVIADPVRDPATGRTMPARKYIADFRYTKDGETYVEDVKSPATRKESTYRLKRHLFLLRYPTIKFREI